MPFLIIGIICLFTVLIIVVVLYSFGKKISPIEDTEHSFDIGDIIKFGNYEQDNNRLDGKEPIEWIVLKTEDDFALLISAYCLDYEPYNMNSTDVSWELSTLREWLNNDFMDETFSRREKKMIVTQTVENPGLYMGVDHNGNWIVTNDDEYVEEPLYQTENSNSTRDNVFLLSADDAIFYLGTDNIAYLPLTEYAKEKSWKPP